MSEVYPHGRPYGSPGLKRFDPATIHWSLNGHPCSVIWTSFEATAPGGYGQFTAQAQPQRGRRVRMKQGDHVIGKKPNGDVCYEGRLSQNPKYIDDVAYFTAMGPRTQLDRFNQRLPYQIRDGSQWHELHTDPADFGASGGEKYQITQKGNSIGFQLQSGQSYGSGDHAGYYLWVQDWDINNLQFTYRTTFTNANYDIRIRYSDDDFSAPSNVNSFSCTTADGTTKNFTGFPSGASVAIIDINANGSDTPGNNRRSWFQGLRVGVITDQDVFTSGEVAEDVGNRMGYQTSTVGASNMMPLDWNAPATDLMNYLGDIEDQVWLVMDSDRKDTYGKLIFRPWGHQTWQTNMDWAEDEGLELEPIYNRVTTMFDNPPGVQQQVRSSPDDFGMRDPFPNRAYDWTEPLQLEDPQPDNSLALAVNAKALSKLIQQRVRGQVKINYVTKGSPFDIQPGDLLALGGFQPKVPPQRIAAVTYNYTGDVTCSLGIDYNIAALVDKRITRHLKRRNRRR